MGDGAALLQNVLADGEADALLLLVADEREMRVEEIVRGVALACLRELDDIDQHVGEGVAGHRAVRSALHLEIEEQAAVAGEDRERAERSLALKAAQRGDLFQAGPVFVLQHHAGWVVVDDPPDDFGRHHDGEEQRVILNDERDVRADGGDGLGVVVDDLVVGAQAGGGAIMTPAAPPSMTPRARERMAAKPGAETPTMIGTPARRTTWFEIARASAGSSFGASPMMPRMVRPVTPQER